MKLRAQSRSTMQLWNEQLGYYHPLTRCQTSTTLPFSWTR